MSQDELLHTSEVARDYKINPATLRYWRSAGRGPASFTLGPAGRVVYRRSEVERWMAEQEASSTRGGQSESSPVVTTGP